MERKVPLTSDEAYHVYNRGAHKQSIFTNEADYDRFLILLHLANHSESIAVGKLAGERSVQGRSLDTVFQIEADKSLVDIYAFCLMPNHFHLILRQKSDEGISRFMKKLTTGYSMYFNIKYEHSGTLFQGRFKSQHIADEAYFRYIFAYVHLNPIDLVAPNWEEKGIRNPERIREFITDYRCSSFYDYSIGVRPERVILAYETAPDFLKTQNDLEDLLSNCKELNPNLSEDRPWKEEGINEHV